MINTFGTLQRVLKYIGVAMWLCLSLHGSV